MRKYLVLFVTTLALSSFAENPVPSAAVSKDAYTLAKTIYSPDTHAKQIEAGVSGTIAQLGTVKGVVVDQDKLRATFSDLLKYQEMVDFQAAVLAKYYSVDELAALTKFYASEVGKKSLVVLPQVTQDAMGFVMQKLSGPGVEKAMKSAISKAPDATSKKAE